jgi:hypothetical protein
MNPERRRKRRVLNMETISSYKQKMRICPLFICPVTTNDVLIDGERIFGPALLLYVHLMQTTQWNNYFLIKPNHLTEALSNKEHVWNELGQIVLSTLDTTSEIQPQRKLYPEPKQLFWFRYMQILYEQISLCMKLEQTKFPQPMQTLPNLLRVFLSGIHFFLLTNPAEALRHVHQFKELSSNLLNLTDDQFNEYNPLLITAYIIWICELDEIVTPELVFDEKITNIDYIIQKVAWKPLQSVPENICDNARMKQYLQFYKVPHESALAVLTNHLLFSSSYLLDNIDWGGDLDSPLEVFD